MFDLTDRLTKETIYSTLNTNFIGRTIKYYESVTSTNEIAKKIIREKGAGSKERDDVEGTVIIAEEQTAGRGRRGRSWSSPFATGIWTSVILRPQMPPSEMPKMALITALAVVRGIEDSATPEAQLKWPNDVLIDGKKVCGILIETDGCVHTSPFAIVGIGINANVPAHDFPAGAYATSLGEVVGKPIDRSKLLTAVLMHLECLYVRWKQDGFEFIRTSIRQRCVSIGQSVRVVEGRNEWEGFGVDIAADGALLVRRVEDGVVVPVYSGDVSLSYGDLF